MRAGEWGGEREGSRSLRNCAAPSGVDELSSEGESVPSERLPSDAANFDTMPNTGAGIESCRTGVC